MSHWFNHGISILDTCLWISLDENAPHYRDIENTGWYLSAVKCSVKFPHEPWSADSPFLRQWQSRLWKLLTFDDGERRFNIHQWLPWKPSIQFFLILIISYRSNPTMRGSFLKRWIRRLMKTVTFQWIFIELITIRCLWKKENLYRVLFSSVRSLIIREAYDVCANVH